MTFADKVVLVTGASRGIGAEIARAFSREGAAVAVNFVKNVDAANSVVDQCKEEGNEAAAFQADVTDIDSGITLVDEVIQHYGKIDILGNNAIRPYKFEPEKRKMFWELDWGHYQSQIEGTLLSTHTLCKAVVPSMTRAANGAIVNVATNLVERPIIPYHDYTTAKAALVGFSKNLAAELGPLGIRVNCVAPGLIPTEMLMETMKVDETAVEKMGAGIAAGRVGTPEDIATACIYLCSEAATGVTGQTIWVTGGPLPSTSTLSRLRRERGDD